MCSGECVCVNECLYMCVCLFLVMRSGMDGGACLLVGTWGEGVGVNVQTRLFLFHIFNCKTIIGNCCSSPIEVFFIFTI